MKNVEYIYKPCEICRKPVRLVKSFEVDDELSENYGKRLQNPLEFQKPIHGTCRKTNNK
jgi:hypothetical protein